MTFDYLIGPEIKRKTNDQKRQRIDDYQSVQPNPELDSQFDDIQADLGDDLRSQSVKFGGNTLQKENKFNL